ncbi:MAG: hypothetical protein IKC87_02515 [Clostridia bacterium]|nr:hypothetical protein [Clostridia bacterium]
MSKNNSLTASYDSLPFILKLIIILVGGVIVGGIYRIIKWTETKNTVTLVVGLLATFTGIGNLIIWIIDVVCTVLYGKITVLAD